MHFCESKGGDALVWWHADPDGNMHVPKHNMTLRHSCTHIRFPAQLTVQLMSIKPVKFLDHAQKCWRTWQEAT